MRVFFALMLPVPVQKELAHLKGKLAWLPARATWTTQANLHITLKFLGELPDKDVVNLATAAKTQVASIAPLTLRPDHLVFFPPAKPARVLGIGFSGDVQPLTEFAAGLEKIAQEFGIAAENRPFTAHATLARFRDGLQARHRPRIEESCRELAQAPEFSVAHYQLMQSQLSATGSTYLVLAEF